MPIVITQNSAAACSTLMKHANNPAVEQTTLGKVIGSTIIAIILILWVIGIVKGIVENISNN